MKNLLRRHTPGGHGGEAEERPVPPTAAGGPHDGKAPDSPSALGSQVADAPLAAEKGSEPADRAPRGGDIPGDLWVPCPKCRQLVYRKELAKNLKVCPKCGYHFTLGARERIALLIDPGTFLELDADMRSGDPIGFVRPNGRTYRAKLEEEAAKAELPEAAVYGLGEMEGLPVVAAVLDYHFLVASMGSVVGEKITRAIERAVAEQRPLVIVSASGGARQDEGIMALMQMAKTTAALTRLAAARLPYISVLTDPTYAGVTASFASQGDCIVAEPGAVIGFAGPRLIEQILRQKLPPDACTAEFQLKHGMVDLVVHRRELKATIARLLKLYADARASSSQAPTISRQLVSALR